MDTTLRPASPDRIRQRIYDLAALPYVRVLDGWKWNTTLGGLSSAAGGDKNRYQILYWLWPDKWESVDAVTSSTLSQQERRALYSWVCPYKDESSGKWLYHAALPEECTRILAAIADQQQFACGMNAGGCLTKTSEEIHDEIRAYLKHITPVMGELEAAVDAIGDGDGVPGRDAVGVAGVADAVLATANHDTTLEANYAAQFGLNKYRLSCGHLNDGYNVIGRPVCTRCGVTSKFPVEMMEAQ